MSLPRGVSTRNPPASSTTNLEQTQFLARNKVDPTYHGPVFSTEVIYVPCGWCGTPVDPVSRVPVGRMFFHPHCLRCAICGKLQPRTMPFAARQGQPVCLSCERNKSVAVPPQRAAEFAERAKATVQGVVTAGGGGAGGGGSSLRSLMEKSATRSPTQRGHSMEMQQLSLQQNDPNYLLVSAEKQHELTATISSTRQSMAQRQQARIMAQLQATNNNSNNNQSKSNNTIMGSGGGGGGEMMSPAIMPPRK